MNRQDFKDKGLERSEQWRNEARTQFEFVLEKDQPGIRSHAMRQFWRQRQANAKEGSSDASPSSRPLYPRILSPNDGTQDHNQFEGLKVFLQQMSALQSKEQRAESASTDKSRTETSGIPAQILAGVRHAFEFVSGDPYDQFPVTLTMAHRKLIYHWLSTHTGATSSVHPTFDPVREVWLPLDFSNTASFHVTMAHAAAHLAYLHGELASPEALHYKTDAISVITKWLDDPLQSLRNETLVSVVRLLMFEKYWGVDGQWEVHRDGLQRLVHARGGLSALREDWRVELAVFVASLIAGPSSYQSSTHAWELSEYLTPTTLHPTVQSTVDRHRPRAIESLRVYPAVYDATILLYNTFQQPSEHGLPSANASVSGQWLKCLVFLSVLFQESVYSSLSALVRDLGIEYTFTNKLPALDESLEISRHRWGGDIEGLYSHLFGDFCHHSDLQRSPEMDFIIRFSDGLEQLSENARGTIRLCLLGMLLEGSSPS
ncbi:hypothetical protein ETB97_007868 [Aspergillus alliaceus]|uniref:Uncharacterized protein n=1 Tax=Petromyces alliaceus TaxID=209559 RepID=A0A8H5ZTM4_PETAA|nr:hypothetical protein ETB97_007868 [Aspergillus burnettii]